MSCAQINMATFGRIVVATLVLLSVISSSNGQVPHPCCAPRTYSAYIGLQISFKVKDGGVKRSKGLQFNLKLHLHHAQAVHDDVSATTDILWEEGMYYFDGNRTRIAFNFTVTPLLVNQTSSQIYIISDYEKKVQYTVTDNKQCSKVPLDSPWPKDVGCIPNDSTYMGNPSLGGDKLPVYRWSMTKPDIKQDISVTTDNCTPVSFFTLQIQSQDYHVATSADMYNFTTTIHNINEKFSPPGYCPKETSAQHNLQISPVVERVLRRIAVPKPFGW